MQTLFAGLHQIKIFKYILQTQNIQIVVCISSIIFIANRKYSKKWFAMAFEYFLKTALI